VVGDTSSLLPVVAPLPSLVHGLVLLLGALALHERRVEHPIVPIDLLRSRTFAAACAAGFCVGIGMFGAIMFVPLFIQGALGGSATNSGLVLTPLMLALVGASVGSGQVITRTGRYLWALRSGPVVMAAGFALLARLDEHSAASAPTLGRVVLGLGLGLMMQNLVLVLQNSVASRDIGAATGAGQFFRSMGGAIGVSLMGAVLAAGLPRGQSSPAQLAHAIHPVFVIGLPLMAVAFLLILLIPEIPLRRSVREA
jgi:MFS family permease